MRSSRIISVNTPLGVGYVVELLEDEKLVDKRVIENKSIHFAEEVAENWENGIIQFLRD